MSPVARISPAADVEPHVVSASVGNGLSNGLVAFFLVEVELVGIVYGVASAEVDLDEVEAAVLEEEVAVLLVVLVESHAYAVLVASVVAAAGVMAGVGIYASLHAQLMDVVCHRLEPVGEAGGVDEQLSCLRVAPAEVAVVDVDVVVADSQQSLLAHGVRLVLDD